MSFWTDALFDTCSLVLLARHLADDELDGSAVASVWGLGESLAPTNMSPPLAARLRASIRLCDLPPAKDLQRIFARARLPVQIANVDGLVYATAVYHHYKVVTFDDGLAVACEKADVPVRRLTGGLDVLISAGPTPEKKGPVSRLPAGRRKRPVASAGVAPE